MGGSMHDLRATALRQIAAAPPIGGTLSISLDLMRFLSAQLVFWGHLGSFLGGPDFLFGGRWQVQNLGVVVFFLLSGFLILRTLPRYSGFGPYFIDRFARIYLTLIPGLLLIAAMDWAIARNGDTSFAGARGLGTLLGNLFMLQDFTLLRALPSLDITSFGSARPLWTLAVEWWLYMFVGWIFLGPRRRWITALLAIVPIAFATFERGNALTLIWLLGGALAFLPGLKITRHHSRAAMLLALLMFVLRLMRSGDFYDLQAALYLAAFLALLCLEARSASWFDRLSGGTIRLVQTLSGASYALYILHYSVIVLLISSGLATQWVVLGSVILANGLAIAVYLLFDRHHRRLAGRLRQILGYPQRDTPAATQGQHPGPASR